MPKADVKPNDVMLGAIHGLGTLYANQGKIGEAEKMYQRALQGYEKAWGPDHTLTLGTVNNLGNLYADQGNLGEAEKMYQRALQGYEKALDPDVAASHIPALNTIYNLGLLFAWQEDKARARETYSKALAGYQNVFGVEHQECQEVKEKLSALQISDGESGISNSEVRCFRSSLLFATASREGGRPALATLLAKKSQDWPALSAGQGYWWTSHRRPNYQQATREHFENHPTHDCESILQSITPRSWDRTPLGCSRAALSEGGYRRVGVTTYRSQNDQVKTNANDTIRRAGIHAENDETPWLVGGTTVCCLAVPGTGGIQVGELLQDTVGLVGEILQGSAKQIDSLRGAAYNGSDGRLGGRTAVTTLSIWLERTDARVGLLKGQNPEDGHRGWSL
ncbi:hypothetical protein GQ44DRAFT_763487 [Phaeosphaeriaceae sp. PMI808]|nr:hypothetical protein GQ44DRAFT_763487 [Phaeosphaeriaceae sp. PMI808]